MDLSDVVLQALHAIEFASAVGAVAALEAPVNAARELGVLLRHDAWASLQLFIELHVRSIGQPAQTI